VYESRVLSAYVLLTKGHQHHRPIDLVGGWKLAETGIICVHAAAAEEEEEEDMACPVNNER
jgi:hypothetical protein